MIIAFFQVQCFGGARIPIGYKKYGDVVAYIVVMILSLSIETVSSFKPQQ
jgi:hypothetical protein